MSFFIYLLAFIIFPLQLCYAKKQFYIQVGKASTSTSSLAIDIPQNLSTQSVARNLPFNLRRNIENNFIMTDYFKIISISSFPKKASRSLFPYPQSASGFKYQTWNGVSEFLLKLGFLVENNQLTVNAYLYSIYQKKNVFQKKYTLPLKSISKMANLISHDMVFSITGKPSIFLSEFVVSSNRGKSKNVKNIFRMNWNGENVVPVSSHKSITTSPAWSKNKTKIGFSMYAYHKKNKIQNLDIFMYDSILKKTFLVSAKYGLNIMGSFHPTKETFFATLSKKGVSNIVEMDFKGRILRKITNSTVGMNVEGQVSPDGKKITYSSDRRGRPMVFVQDLASKSLKQLTFAGRYNASPVWSNDGKKIAFAGMGKGNFDIFTVDVNGSNMKRITSTKRLDGKWSNNEDPSFSPDNRFVSFVSDRYGSKQIFIANLQTGRVSQITRDKYNYFKPKWSY